VPADATRAELITTAVHVLTTETRGKTEAERRDFCVGLVDALNGATLVPLGMPPATVDELLRGLPS
jgi:hypothetical protein